MATYRLLRRRVALVMRPARHGELATPRALIDGHDLLRELRLSPGPHIGKLLETILDAQLEGRLKTKRQALRYAKDLSRNTNQ